MPVVLQRTQTQFSLFSVWFFISFYLCIAELVFVDCMELRLGLALPIHGIKWFDLNTPKDACSGVTLGCGLGSKKRDFDEAFEKGGTIKTLPLLWKDQADDDDDSASNILGKAPASHHVNRSPIVGWPPVKASRKLISRRESIDDNVCKVGTQGGAGSNSLCVKVKMEGVAIGRKVDLALHDSYQALIATLNLMFGIHLKNVKEGVSVEKSNCKLTYQDKDGDWMLVGDVPWGTFVVSVQRLKIQKNSD